VFESAVLDSASTGALLWLARNEGLLHENRRRTDAFIDFHAPKRVPAWLRDQLFEQIVLTPKLTTFQRLPQEGLTGELLDSGLLMSLEQPVVNRVPLRVPAEMIIGALHARGHALSWQEVQTRFERAWLADVEAGRFESERGRPLPTDWMWVDARVRAFMEGKPNDNNEPPEGYTREDVQMAMRHRSERWEAQPILDAINELLQLFAHAQPSRHRADARQNNFDRRRSSGHHSRRGAVPDRGTQARCSNSRLDPAQYDGHCERPGSRQPATPLASLAERARNGKHQTSHAH
jgi:hypothetical protein